MPEIILNESTDIVKNKAALIKDHIEQNTWTLYYPQYMPCTVIPLMESNKTLMLTGFCLFLLMIR